MLRGTGISTHVPRTGHDGRSSSSLYALDVFQSTRPLRGATIVDGLRDDDKDKFQSTCPVRGTTQRVQDLRTRVTHFNPRAPYGARLHRLIAVQDIEYISIHVPRTGHDAVWGKHGLPPFEFQSTCPVRGTTAKMHK